MNPLAVGDQGRAHGIYQIREDFHPDISLEQMEDPHWAASWAIKQLALGHDDLWYNCSNQFKTKLSTL